MCDSAKSLRKGDEQNPNLLSKAYIKTYTLLTDGEQSPLFKSTANKDIYPGGSINGEQVKEKVLTWFFSLPLELRIKIATVEKEKILVMIHQMYFRYKTDAKVVFQFKPIKTDDSESSSNSNNKYVYTTGNTSCNYSSYSSSSSENLEDITILNLLNWKSNRNEGGDMMMEKIWLGDVKVYSINSDFDSMTVSPRVLKDRALFDYYFKYIASPKCFNNLIKPIVQSINKNKLFDYDLPEWFDKKSFHSVGQFIAAYIEQAILVKYVLNYGKKEKYICSLVNEKSMQEFFSKRKEVLSCLQKYYDGDNKKQLFEHISARKVYNDVAYDKEIEDKIKKMNTHRDMGYQTFMSRKLNALKVPYFTGNGDLETEQKIQSKYFNDHVISFVDKVLYHELDDLWKEGYFISKKLFEYLYSLYTDKNYEELVNDMIDDSEKKNPKKTKKTKSENKNQNNNIIKKKKSLKDSDNKDGKKYNFEDDPDYEYYQVYFLEAKNQNSLPTNDLKETSIITNYFKTTLNQVNKEFLYDSYSSGKSKIIYDFIKNQILQEIIQKVLDSNLSEKNPKISNYDSQVKAETTDPISKKPLYEEILLDLNEIKNKNKIISDILIKEQQNLTLTSPDSLNVEEEIENGIEEIKEKEILKIHECEPKEVSVEPFDTHIKNLEIPNNNEISEEPNEGIENTDQKIDSLTENSQIVTMKPIPKTQDKKKKKEPTFFLYDTSKKKKEKQNNKNLPNQIAASSISGKNTNEASNPNKNSNNSINRTSQIPLYLKNSHNTIKNEEALISSNSTNSSCGNNNSYNENWSQTNPKEKTNFSSSNKNLSSSEDSLSISNTKYSKSQSRSFKDQNNSTNFKDWNNSLSERNNSNSSPNKYFYSNSKKYDTPKSESNNFYFFNQVTNINNSQFIPFNLNNKGAQSNQNMRDIKTNMNMNRYSNDFLTFVYKLHNDIITYHQNVIDTLESIREVKIFVIQYIENLIKENLGIDFCIDIYGSFASDLLIESSDIDIKIKLNNNLENFDLEQTLIKLVKKFNSLNIFESVIPIYTATVPIIKISIDPEKIADDDNQMRLEEFKNSKFFKNYKFDKEEILKIKIDLTFLGLGYENEYLNK